MQGKPFVYAIMATCGRHTLAERALACFTAQDYEDPHTLLIYNNSEVPLEVGEFPQLKYAGIHLVNNHIDRETGEPYGNLGAIYRDALSDVPDNVKVIIHWDDDDLYLTNHISEGVKGFLKAKDLSPRFMAYKPQFSWFRHPLGIEKMSNNLEPSIFIDAQYLRKKGYKLTTTDQHYGWYQALLEEQALYVDTHGPSTLVYNWGDSIPTFKTSGDAGNPDNFSNYRNFSRDHGDRLITPLNMGELNGYYEQIYRAEKEDKKLVANVS